MRDGKFCLRRVPDKSESAPHLVEKKSGDEICHTRIVRRYSFGAGMSAYCSAAFIGLGAYDTDGDMLRIYVQVVKYIIEQINL